MNKDSINQLDDLFAQAKEVPLLPSEERVQKVINDKGIKDGNGTSGRRLQKPHSRFTTTRGITMTLTILGLAGLLGIGTLYLGPTGQSNHNAPTVVITKSAPPAAAQAFPSSDATPSIPQPLLVGKPATALLSTPQSVGGNANLHGVDFKREDSQPPSDTARQHLANTFVDQFGKTLSDFWLNKINGYKQQIDAMLAPDDLSRLNRLRVRWSLAKGGIATMLGATASENSLNLSFSFGNKKSSSEEEKGSMEYDGGNQKMKEMAEGMDLTMMLPFIRQMMLQDTSESGQIFANTIRLSDQYRPGLDELRGHVMRDVSEFVDLLASQASAFIEQHKGELRQEDQKKVEEIRTKIGEGIAEIKSHEKIVAAVYGAILEPVVMLYNGSDISGLISSAITEPVAGLKLSENQTLKQSIPNPAAGSVAINYTLTEPSQRTMLRVFDAAGNVVATADQGGRPAGDHTINLDVSKWENGTYLYHLTTQTSSGERVFSKTMQVVK